MKYKVVHSCNSIFVTETTGGKSSWKETDSQGLVTQAHDNGGDIVYAYYPDGKAKTISAHGSEVTTMEYTNAARNQTKLIDPQDQRHRIYVQRFRTTENPKKCPQPDHHV